ncbi:MAG: toll/interleukin-1 receptor domain-containing protein [Magnetococcales bacterium]|nr:toll/interleukin-1 receptor domain-containing protein [Magnetococcales bacterium]
MTQTINSGNGCYNTQTKVTVHNHPGVAPEQPHPICHPPAGWSPSEGYDVFISYSSQDRKFAHTLAERLLADGLKIWFDEWVLKPGDPISVAVEDGLEKSRILLAILSPQFLHSEWTKVERGAAMFRDPANRTRRFIPVLYQDCKLPDMLAQYKQIDLRANAPEEYKKLLEACRQRG